MKTLLLLDDPVSVRLQPKSSLNDSRDVKDQLAERPNLQAQVTLLAYSIRNRTLREAMDKVLADLVFLLDYLALIDSGPRPPSLFREVLSILEGARAEACALVDFIENHTMRLDGLSESLRDALDSTAYAIKHEVERIFDGELARSRFDHTDHQAYVTLLHAHAVLTNCCQQCLISLAREFDDRLTGVQLFHDWQLRREKSLRLCQDLSALIDLVRDTQKKSLDTIVRGLRSFREGSMQCLMYKDWPEFERQSDEIIESIENKETPTQLLACFDCYLETLLGQVRSRAVLADPELETYLFDQEPSLSYA